MSGDQPLSVDQLLFVGLNGYVAALDRASGDVVWKTAQLSSLTQYTTLLPDVDCVYVSAGGYLYCLDALTGDQRWYQPLKGFGTGVASLATTRAQALQEMLGLAATDGAIAAAAAREATSQAG